MASLAHLVALKVLSEREGREQDRLDLDALLREATQADIQEARRALQLVTARRANRGKDLQATLQHFLSRLEG